MLRIHCVQLCYNLSDPAMEDLLYEAESVRRFCGLTLSGPIPDESTILHFRHLLERHQLGETLLETGPDKGCGCKPARSWTRASSQRRPRPRSPARPGDAPARKGNEWYFGMKLHGTEPRPA